MFRTYLVVALLSCGLLVGCGSSSGDPDSWNELDQALGDSPTNGCNPNKESYEDLRNQASVTITDPVGTKDNAWVDPHNRCIGVSSGTVVTWVGNFDDHPLVGGENGIEDSSSPITEEMATSGTDPATVTFDNETGQIEVEGYFCDVHRTTMRGVIAVFP